VKPDRLRRARERSLNETLFKRSAYATLPLPLSKTPSLAGRGWISLLKYEAISSGTLRENPAANAENIAP